MRNYVRHQSLLACVLDAASRANCRSFTQSSSVSCRDYDQRGKEAMPCSRSSTCSGGIVTGCFVFSRSAFDRRVRAGFFRGKKSLGNHAGEVPLRLG